MASARLMRLLSRLAARDLAAATGRAAEAAANLRSMARNVSVLDGYTRDLSAALAGGAQSGYDFAVTMQFRASGIRASGDAAAAMNRGQVLQRAALDRLAGELQRRDAIASTVDVIEAEAERARARLEGQGRSHWTPSRASP
jgi:hypothetical protein